MDIAWVKRTVNRKLAKCHGYYLQHAKETCLVGIKVSKIVKATLLISFCVLGTNRFRNFEQNRWK